jgi:hypothetical protein
MMHRKPMSKRMLRTMLVLAAVFVLLAACACYGAEPAPRFNCYFGNLHSHTSYSDGVLTPSDAFQHARDVALLDFLAVTDHGYYFQEATNMHHWFMSLEEADAFYEPGRFVSMIGFEWTFTDGHMNGLDTPLAASRDTQRNVAEFIDFLTGHDGIGTFNHPDYDIQPNWNDFEYLGEGDRVVYLLEVGSGPYRHNIRNERAYQRALDRGWHVGAISCQDNHSAHWGTAAPTRTGALARELTREAIYESLRSMRTYATEDSNVRAFFELGECQMGSEVVISRDDLNSGRVLRFSIVIDDPDESDMIALVQVVTNGGVVAWESEVDGANFFEAEVDIVPASSYNWYYVRAVQADADVIVTSPIWVSTESQVAVCDFGCVDLVPQVGKAARVRAEIVNRNDDAIPGATAILYEVREGEPVRCSSLEVDLPGGRGTAVSFEWTPKEAGETSFIMELVISGREGAPDIYPGGSTRVRPSDIKNVIIDEGHNNRCSGYMDAFVRLLGEAEYNPSINEGSIDSKLLEDADMLVINVPEMGFSLTPTSYDDNELDAIAAFVLDGGSLLLAGGSDFPGFRDCGQLNTVLERIGSAIRFGRDEIRQEDSSVVDVEWGTARAVYADEACSLAGPGWSAIDGMEEVVVLARAMGSLSVDVSGDGMHFPYTQSPVFAVAQTIGSGRLVCLGAPVYSSYDLDRERCGNAAFTLAVISWLAGGEWKEQ